MSSYTFFRGLVAQERGLFTRVVGAVIEDGLEYRPDPKSRCSRDLIEHLLGHNLDLVELFEEGAIHHRNQVPFDSLDGVVQQYDDSFAQALSALDAMDEALWLAPATFYVGDQVVAEGNRESLAWMMLLDAIHHRGQLSTYLRPMGSKVPSIYGPSADEPAPAH
jgi:uncharacterized damage-inducible protein DinB